MNSTDDAAELQHLQCELADRLDEHPMSEWSVSLLRAVIATVDLGYGPSGPKPEGPPRLTVVP